MPIKVVDASAIAAILFVEPEADSVAERIQGFGLASPTLLPYEVASVCLKKIKKHPSLRRGLLDSLTDLHRMSIAAHLVPTIGAVELAQRLGLTPYDASYVWVALSLDAELVTLDKQLERAHRRLARG